jgi:drug/metabolite transporter (DMT)-like permease
MRMPPLVLLLVGICGVSTATLWARCSAAGPFELAFRRLALTVPLLWLFDVLRGRPSAPWTVAGTTVLASGVCLAVHFAAYFAALQRLSAAVTLALVSLHPVLLATLEGCCGKERPTRGQWIGVGLATGGALWLVRDELLRGAGSLEGMAWGLLSAVAMAGYLLAGRRATPVLGANLYARRSYTVAAVALGGGLAVAKRSLWPENALEWQLAWLLAVFPTVLGHTPLNAALRHLPASAVSTAFLGELAGASLLVWLVLGEAPPTGFWLGGTAIAAGIVLAARPRPVPPARSGGAFDTV